MKSEKRREERKRKVKVKTAFCFLCMPELRKLIFCIWIRRPRSVRPVNQFVVSFSSTVTRKPLDKLQNTFFGKISRSEWVKSIINRGYFGSRGFHLLFSPNKLEPQSGDYTMQKGKVKKTFLIIITSMRKLRSGSDPQGSD